jgi:hypothetical protein
MFHTVVDLFEDREYLKIWQFYWENWWMII